MGRSEELQSTERERSYIRVLWHHEKQNEPVELWSELDADRFETRKLEYFRDGRVGLADELCEVNGTALGVIAVPTLSEIAADPQFEPYTITQPEFDLRWREAQAITSR